MKADRCLEWWKWRICPVVWWIRTSFQGQDYETSKAPFHCWEPNACFGSQLGHSILLWAYINLPNITSILSLRAKGFNKYFLEFGQITSMYCYMRLHDIHKKQILHSRLNAYMQVRTMLFLDGAINVSVRPSRGAESTKPWEDQTGVWQEVLLLNCRTHCTSSIARKYILWKTLGTAERGSPEGCRDSKEDISNFRCSNCRRLIKANEGKEKCKLLTIVQRS